MSDFHGRNFFGYLWVGLTGVAVVVCVVAWGILLRQPQRNAGGRTSLVPFESNQETVWTTPVDCGEAKLQPRETAQAVEVPLAAIKIFDDDPDLDTLTIFWSDNDHETVRILGIDGAEIAHPGLWPEDQSFGPEGRGFMLGVLSASSCLELVRARCLDKYGRTLGYLFFDGRNYSVLAVGSGLAFETIAKYGDNGLPEFAAEVLKAADRFGEPHLDENPSDFRKRMREKYADHK